MRTLLLGTVHGSRLYGLSHAGSDYDYFAVHGWDKFKGHQRVAGIDDRLNTSYDRFMRYAERGVPQYLEAMWSPAADVDNMPFNRFLFRPTVSQARDTYLRTVKSFWRSGWEEQSFKKRRHALRLMLNLRTMEAYGRFNPTMTAAEIEWANAHANDNNLPELPWATQ